MRGYIVGYTESWENNINPKIIGSFSNWKAALNEARKIIRPLITVYIVETEINAVISPTSPCSMWYRDFKHYIITENGIKKFTSLHQDQQQAFQL